MITIKEIAAQLGVSPTTVSNVVNGRTARMSEVTRQKIEEALIRNHYVQDSKTRRNQPELKLVFTGFFFGDEKRVFTDPFCGEFFETVEREMRARGRSVIFGALKTEEELLEKLSVHNVEGAIVLGCSPSKCEQLCKRTLKPLVFIDSGEGDYDNIGLQDEEGAHELTAYLIRQGHRKIAFFCDEKEALASNAARYRGFRETLLDAGIQTQSEDYFYLPQDKNMRYEVCRQFARNAKENGYTAAFFVADLYANEAISQFFSKNLKVPDDISVAGFDDNIYARLSRPTLTTVRQSPELKGKEAVKLLMKRIYGEEVVVRSLELPTELIVRESVRNIWNE